MTTLRHHALGTGSSTPPADWPTVLTSLALWVVAPIAFWTAFAVAIVLLTR